MRSGLVKLLIIDDEQLMYEAGKVYFEGKGYRVFYTNSGKAGIEIFKVEKPDVVILDLCLGDIDGKEVLIELKKIDNRVKVVVLTGFSGEDIKDTLSTLGVDAFFTKPCRFPLVAEEIGKWFNR